MTIGELPAQVAVLMYTALLFAIATALWMLCKINMTLHEFWRSLIVTGGMNGRARTLKEGELVFVRHELEQARKLLREHHDWQILSDGYADSPLCKDTMRVLR